MKNHNTDAFNIDGFTLRQIEGYSSDFIDRLMVMEFFIEGVSVKIETTIKRSGETRRYVKDRRMPGLLQYLAGTELTVELLKNELDNYDDARERTTEAALAFEKTLEPVLEDKIIETLATDKPLVFWEIIDCLKEKGLADALSEAEMKTLMEIRNMYSHNQYHFVEGLVLNGEKVATVLYNRFVELTNRILTHFNLLIDDTIPDLPVADV